MSSVVKRASVIVVFIFTLAHFAGGASAQDFIRYDRFESERSDKLTGGRIERAEFEPGQPDVRLTLNVPSFRLTLWQNGKEVASYAVGVGLKDYPIYIGDREFTEIIYNPAWIPPASDWVSGRSGVKPGDVIPATDPRNPLGKMKIPLGDAYLIHQAAKTTDLGNLVSHGCVRMLRRDLYDLSEKIIAARSASVSPSEIARAKRTKRTLTVALDEPVHFDINYDTLVVEGGVLHIYPDVYDRRTNTVPRLRDELKTSGVDDSSIDDATLAAMLEKVTRRTRFVVDVRSIKNGRALAEGRNVPLLQEGNDAPRRARAKGRAADGR